MLHVMYLLIYFRTLQEADHLRKEGNEHFNHFKFSEAIKFYIRARKMYEKCGLTELEAKTWCNISFVYLKLDEPENSLECAIKAVHLDPTYCKVSDWILFLELLI